MTDLISRQAAIEAVSRGCQEFRGIFEECDKNLNELPTIDPVKHGKWKLAKDGWYCSVCGLYPPFDCDPEENEIPFCSNCGSRMDL